MIDKNTIDTAKNIMKVLQGLLLDEKDLNTELKKANNLFHVRKYHHALKKYEELSVLFPKSLRPLLGQIATYRKLGMNFEALAICGSARKLSTGDDVREARIYNTMAAIALEQYDSSFKIENLNEGLEFLNKASMRSDDLFISGNIVEANLNAVLTLKDHCTKIYMDTAKKELNLIMQRLKTRSFNKYGIQDVEKMIPSVINLFKDSESEMFSWLKTLIVNIHTEIKHIQSEEVTMVTENTLPSKYNFKNATTLIIAILLIFSLFTTGYIVLDKHFNTKPVVEQSQKGKNSTKNISINVSKISNTKHISITEPDIDRMTS